MQILNDDNGILLLFFLVSNSEETPISIILLNESERWITLKI